MVKIAFWCNDLCGRGTTVAVHDYAYYNKKMLNNKSYIFYDKNNTFNNEDIKKKLEEEFIVRGFDSFTEVDNYMKNENIEIIYIIKYGVYDDRVSKVAKTFVHCVFECSQPHGDIYAAISSNVSCYNENIPILPHIVDLPNHNEDMKSILNIPDNALVLGRHGGNTTFNISFTHQTIYDLALSNENIYFVFANTNRFCPSLKNIIHLDFIIDLHEKRKFINTCDAMIWAREDGESFGIAIGEFSICNKPILAFGGHCAFNNHKSILKENALWFNNEEELHNQIMYLFDHKETIKQRDWNMYKEYTPEKVMKIFTNLILS
jgi:hypothetical protein